MIEIEVGQWYQLATGEQVRVDALDDDAGLVSVTTSDGKVMELLMTALNRATVAANRPPEQSVDDEAYWSKVAEMLDETDWQQQARETADPGALDAPGADVDAAAPMPEMTLETTIPEPLRPGSRPEMPVPPLLDEPTDDSPYRSAEPAATDEAGQLSFDDAAPASEPTPAPGSAEGARGLPSGESRLPLWLAAIAVLLTLGSSVYQQIRTELLEERVAELAVSRSGQAQQAALARGLDAIEMMRGDVAALAAIAEQVDRLRGEATLATQERDMLRKSDTELGAHIEGLRSSHNQAVGDLRAQLATLEGTRGVESGGVAVPAAPEVEIAEAAPSGGRYVVVVVSLPTAKRVTQARAQLEAKGMSVVERTAMVDGRTWYRLQVEGFASRKVAMDYVAGLAREHGIDDAWVLRR